MYRHWTGVCASEWSIRVNEHISVSADVNAGEWNAFVHHHGDASGYHQWEWRNVFEQALGLRCHYLAARDGDAIVGVLPLAEVRSRIFGRALSSLPYVNYGGVLAVNAEARQALIQEAGRRADARSLSYVVLRHRRRLCPELPVRTHKVTMLLPLAPTSDEMWSGLDGKVRNQIRKAEKSGLVIESGGDALVDEFYTVFARNMRDLGTPVYSRSLFASIVANFPSAAKVHIVRLNGQPIACALSYGYGDVVEVPSASSLREHRALCPNHLMYWSIITAAIAEGRKVFDFGRSSPDDGTYKFKEQWGAVSEQLWWEYRLTADATLPADDRHSAKFHATIEAWKRLPLAVATLLGPRIARSVP
jgi:FemAB-related protein (PEP-CTERM system-associated)